MEKKNCFISYTTRTDTTGTAADERWAIWLEWCLRAELGQSTRMQKYDSPPGGNFIQFMHESLRQADIVVCVLSKSYLQSNNCTKEWTNADELRVVRVDDCQPGDLGLLNSRVYIDLYGLDEAKAIQKLREGWESPPRPEENPGFPGGASASASAPAPASAPASAESPKPDFPANPNASKERKNEAVAEIPATPPPVQGSGPVMEGLTCQGSKPGDSKAPGNGPIGDERAKKILDLLAVVALLTVVLALVAVGVFALYIPPDSRPPEGVWTTIALSPSEEWFDGKAYAAYVEGTFDLSAAHAIRLTFEPSQAGTQFLLRLAPAGTEPNKPSGVRWEVLSIPAGGVVIVPLKPEAFGLKPEDMRQLTQIAVLSGDNAWNSPLGQGADMQAYFRKIEVLRGK